MRAYRLVTSASLLSAMSACADLDPVAPDSRLRPVAREASSTTLRDIRIGVVQSASTITLGSAGDYTVRNKTTGAQLFTGTNGAVSVVIASPASSIARLQVTCSANISVRKAAAEAAGYATFTEFVPAANCTRLYLGELINSTAAQRTTFRNQAIASGHAGSDSFFRTFSAGASYRVTQGTSSVVVVSPVSISSTTGRVTINGRTYRGKGEARVNSGGTLAGVNELPLEQYLYGVVPRELGPIAYPEIEAQKAQAVAARTFALTGYDRRSSDGYDLRASTDDQVYGGLQDEHPISNSAVDATAGIAAAVDGRLISTLYSSASGGHTADNEESFAAAPVAYLRGVPDAQRGKALEHVPSLEVFKAHARPTSLRAMKEGDSESDWSRFHRWTFEWDNDEISRIVSTYAKQNVGKVLAINAVERGPSGRILTLEYVTEAGTFTAVKFAIRSSLTYITSTGSLSALPSTLFFVEEIIHPRTKELEGFRVYGGGFGHGVGLSQTGAVGMAEKGATYQEILAHYYRGVELLQWY